MNHFHSFILHPHVRFDAQEDDEDIILLLRAHPITQLPVIINSVTLIIFLIVIDYFVKGYASFAKLFFVNLFGFLLIFSYAWYNFLKWFFNVGLVTTKRIVDVDFTGMVSKEVTEARLSRIEDVTSKNVGYLGSLFNYGDVFVQTAGTEANIEFFQIPNPAQTVKIINGILSK
jgi:hypothetical protein